MKKILLLLFSPTSTYTLNWAILGFRILLSLELIIVHGFKKIGIGISTIEKIPNPLDLPEALNQAFATMANIVFPVFVILGLCTRLACIPILSVTMVGYFVLHFHDAALVRDVPFMYSISYLLILIVGAGKYSIDTWIYEKIRNKK